MRRADESGHHIAVMILGSGIDPRNPPGEVKKKIEIKPVKLRPFLGGRWGAEVDASKTLTINVTFRLGSLPPGSPTPVLLGSPGDAARPLPPGRSAFVPPACNACAPSCPQVAYPATSPIYVVPRPNRPRDVPWEQSGGSRSPCDQQPVPMATGRSSPEEGTLRRKGATAQSPRARTQTDD